MSTLRVMVLATVVSLLSTVPATAQRRPPRQRVSPHETVSAVIAGNRVTVTYGRPYSKNPRGTDIRKIWGSLVPYGEAWRIGADEATLILLKKGIKIGDAVIPAGAYTLYLIPEENGGKLAFSKTLGGWEFRSTRRMIWSGSTSRRSRSRRHLINWRSPSRRPTTAACSRSCGKTHNTQWTSPTNSAPITSPLHRSSEAI